ncbi:MAG: class I SAM-dependent methyltransferase [Alphaproteobacteria bacterium]|nr:class I SAM-dependent methyltransferase [Alphaproteobacteria bacterium]
MDKVQAQYERWIYPEPVEDLEAWIAGGAISAGDARECGDIFWPATGYREGMNILVAGCGANQAARYALKHPTAKVTGIDLSEASLAHEEKLKTKHGLDNLTLHRMRLEEISKLGQAFDFIASSGVLHHLPDPVAGLKALAGVLDRDGVIYIMLYGRYGRTPVYMMQDLFRRLHMGQTEDDVALVKETIRLLPPEHPLRPYETRSTDMKFDSGLVDLFLHQQDRPYSVPEIMEFTRDGGLTFQAWVQPAFYNPDVAIPENHPLYQRMEQLPDEERWAAMELFGGILSRHDFCVCRPDRPRDSYNIDFTDPGFAGRAVPLSQGGTLASAAAGRPAILSSPRRPPMTLPPPLATIFQQIDGARTIAQCLESAPLNAPPEIIQQHGMRFFRTLSRTGHVAFRLKETS